MTLIILRDEDFFEKHKEICKEHSYDIYVSFLDENNKKVKKSHFDKKKRYRVYFDDYDNGVTYQLGTDDTESGETESEYYDLDFLVVLFSGYAVSIFHVIVA